MDEELSELESGAVMRDHILDMMNVCYHDLLDQSSLKDEQQQVTMYTGAEWSPDTTTLLPTQSEGSIPLRRSLWHTATPGDNQRLAAKQGDSVAMQSKSGELKASDRWRSFVSKAPRPLVLILIVLVVAIAIVFAYAIITGARLAPDRTKQGLARSFNDTDTALG
ncbi:uncharacterized protein LOC125940442 [Dermacentor silvarum]|uniref:uncharacterized protein LOC125940442 n=1 Tax=Dermacentor silvarum TaxID=543639 RepID=UPI002101B56C|nr:uncharacterized protein LOC125940442 [Dermacentor silvarum]